MHLQTSPPSLDQSHNDRLIELFNGLFAQPYNTHLVCALSNGRKGEQDDDLSFRLAVSAQARQYLQQGLPNRAAMLVQVLQQTFGGQLAMHELYWPEES
jgi:elongation factor P hydroxylase